MEATDPIKGLYRTGGIAAIGIVVLIPVQLLIFFIWPPPETVEGYFVLFRMNRLLGLLSLDLLYILSNALLILVYLGLYAALRRTRPASMLIALALGLIGIASYYASTVAFEMLSLSDQYFRAGTTNLKLHCLASGQAMLAIYKGTAFNVYYVLNAITLLIVSGVMLRNKNFSKATGRWGLASGVLMMLPTTAGTAGLVCGIASLLPWTVFSILTALALFKLSRRSGLTYEP